MRHSSYGRAHASSRIIRIATGEVLMAHGLAKTLAGIFGFGFCKAALGVAYLTAMGSVISSVGFISELSFMVPMLVASFATASLIVLAVRKCRLPARSLGQHPATVARYRWILSRGMNLLSVFPNGATALLCGFPAGSPPLPSTPCGSMPSPPNETRPHGYPDHRRPGRSRSSSR